MPVVSTVRDKLAPYAREAASALAWGPAACLLACSWLFLVDRAAAFVLDEGAEPLGLAGAVTLWSAHALVALVLGVGLGLVLLGQQRAPGFRPALVGGALALGALFFWLGASATAGDWVKNQWWAPWLRWGSPALGALLGTAVAWLLHRSWQSRRLWWLWALLSLAASIVDAAALPGLYPDIHLGLHLLAACFALLLAARACSLLGPSRRPALSAAATLACLGAAVGPWLAMGPGARSEVALASPLADHLVAQFSTRPPGSLLKRELLRKAPAHGRAASRSSQRWLAGGADYNVVLVVVDTLRSDALPPSRSGKRDFARNGDTPFLDRWIGENFHFSRAYAQSSRTKRSMPPMFTSAEPSADTSRAGLPLPRLMASLGKMPVAVVPQYFLMPFEREAQRLLEGFALTEVYEKDNQDAMGGRVEHLLRSLREQPFFAWIHFYNMHGPFYAGRLMGKEDGSPRERYRMALKWLDAEMKKLIALLDELQLAERTVVVFAADHGESLGDHRLIAHGTSTFDSEMKVPLVISVPGKGGGRIDRLVGNIDIVPTLLDLLEAEPLPEHRGQSLVPLLHDPNSQWDRSYYLQSGDGKQHALVQGHQKIVYVPKTGVLRRYDLGRDPRERRDRYQSHSPIDIELQSALVRRSPALAADELEREPELRGEVARQLDRLEARSLDERAEFLLQTAALGPDRAVLAAAERLFRRGEDRALRLAIIHHLFAHDRERFSALLLEMLKPLSIAEASPIAAALSRRAQPRVLARYIARRVGRELPELTPAQWEPWLRLISPWRKGRARWLKSFASMLARGGQESASPETLRLLLENVADMDKRARELAEPVRAYLEHPQPLVVAAAVKALGRIGRRPDAQILRPLLRQRELDVRIRQALMDTLARLENEKNAVKAVTRLGGDELLTYDAIKILDRLASEHGRPYLEDIVENHYNHHTRNAAKRALKSIERKAKRVAAKADAQARVEAQK
ncbi:MAG: sulfatase-like hydrolase/transferase [Myxococcales bacterium]|nr:sulfatase-like hydrolase/transferase [Myxococcales bacterium]